MANTIKILLIVPPLFFVFIGILCLFKPSFVEKKLITIDWQSRKKNLNEVTTNYTDSRIKPKFIRLLGVILFAVGAFYCIKVLI